MNEEGDSEHGAAPNFALNRNLAPMGDDNNLYDLRAEIFPTGLGTASSTSTAVRSACLITSCNLMRCGRASEIRHAASNSFSRCPIAHPLQSLLACFLRLIERVARLSHGVTFSRYVFPDACWLTARLTASTRVRECIGLTR